MLKLIESKKEEFFSNEHIAKLEQAFAELPYGIKQITETYGFKYCSAKMYENFKEKYDEIAKNNLFSEYFVRVLLNSKESPEFLPSGHYNYSFEAIPFFAIISVGSAIIYVDDLETYFESKVKTDYTKLDSALLLELSEKVQNKGFELTNEPSGITYDSLENRKDSLFKDSKELSKEIQDAREANHEELISVKAAFDKAKKDLEVKQEQLMVQLRERETELKAMEKNLKKEMGILDAKIYDIKSYLGDSYELIQIRSGREASKSDPFIISQKIRFLNEDLPTLVGLFNSNIFSHENIVEALKYSDKLVEYFCQSDKSISFFRLARDKNVVEEYQNIRQDSSNKGTNPYFFVKQIVSERGHDFVGFLVKNGDNLYLGVIDESHRVIVDEDIFMDLNKGYTSSEPVREQSDYEVEQEKKKNAKEMLARKFLFSMIQGLIEHKKLVSFEKEVNLFQLPPEIVFSAASFSLGNSMYGTFTNLKEKLNKLSRVGDEIFLVDGSNNSHNMKASFSNYVPDVSAIKGVTKISSIETTYKGSTYYISADRENIYNYGTSKALLMIEPGDFVNMDYFNSKWIEYFISNKETDSSSYNGKHFHLFVKILLEMKEHLQKREEVEIEAIKKHYKNIETVENWQVKLSEWKLQQKSMVREITDYQAKRFAKALTESTIKSLPELYATETLVDVVKAKDFSNPKVALKDEIYKVNTTRLSTIKELLESGFFTLIPKSTIEEFLAKGDRRESLTMDNVKDVLTQIRPVQVNTIKNLISEMDEVESNHSFKFFSKNEKIFKVFDILKNYSNDFSALSDYEVAALIKLVRTHRHEFYTEFGFEECRSICKYSESTRISNIARDTLLKYPEFIQVIVPHDSGDGYYPICEGYSREDIIQYLEDTFLRLLLVKYYQGLNTINNQFYYRTKK